MKKEINPPSVYFHLGYFRTSRGRKSVATFLLRLPGSSQPTGNVQTTSQFNREHDYQETLPDNISIPLRTLNSSDPGISDLSAGVGSGN